MKVLFANIPFIRWKGGEIYTGPNAGSRWPWTNPGPHFSGYAPFPFWLSWAMTYAAHHGIDCAAYDGVAQRHWSLDFTRMAFASFKPDVVVYDVATPTVGIIDGIAKWAKESFNCRNVYTGPHMKAYAERWIEQPHVDHCVIGEPDIPVLDICQRGDQAKPIYRFEHLDNIDTLPDGKNFIPWRPPADMLANYYDPSMPTEKIQLTVMTSRGCPFKCLAGDTKINTTHGMIPIRDLVGRSDVGVFTYDRETKEASIQTPRVIAQTGSRQKLVRVTFDDGTHIDCTPDHRFVTFKWGNQHTPEREWLVEAKDMVPGTRVRALRQYKSGEYLDTVWARRGREKTHRLVAEWKLGRKLTESEVVHHVDHDKLNWHPDNLEVIPSQREHFARHPEISVRMKERNPTAGGMSQDWRDRIGASTRGKVRSAETRERMRQAAISREDRKKAAFTFNHKVVSVDELPGEHDTYCMEMPSTGVFYANDVLVKNCSYCQWPNVMNAGKYRARSADAVVDELRQAKAWLGEEMRSIFFDDDTWNLGKSRIEKILAGLKDLGLPWTMMGRIDTSKPELYDRMVDAGCVGMRFGVETFNQTLADNVKKSLDVQVAYENLKYLVTRYSGMEFHFTTMRNLPGEKPGSWQRDQELLQGLERLGAEHGNRVHWQISDCIPFPGTELWEELVAAGHRDTLENFELYDGSPAHDGILQQTVGWLGENYRPKYHEYSGATGAPTNFPTA